MRTDPKALSKEELFRRKKSRRRKLAAMPIEEKIKVLIKIQHLASSVTAQTNRKYKTPWGATK